MTDVLTRPASRPSPPARPGALVVAAPAAAVAAAGAGLLAIAVFVLLAWSADARSGSGTPAALRAAGQVWLTAHGTPVRVPGGVFALLPLGLSANTPPGTRTGVPCASSHTWPAARRAAGVPDSERASADQASRTKTAMASSPAPAETAVTRGESGRRSSPPLSQRPPPAMVRRAGSAQRVSHDLRHQLRALGRGPTDPHPDLLQGFLLRLRRTRGPRHDRAGVSHGLALGRGEAGDVAHHRLGDVRLDVVGGPLLGVPADLADHDDALSLRVILKGLQAVDVGGSADRVAADADAGGEPDLPQLVHHLVSQGAALADEPQRPALGDRGGDDAGVGLLRADQPRAVRTDDPGDVAPAAGVGPELGAVVHRDALGDDHTQRYAGVHGFLDRGLSPGRGHEPDRDVGPGFGDRLLHGTEHRDAVNIRPRLARVDAGDDVGPGGHHPPGVLGAFGAGDALDEDLAVRVEKGRHGSSGLLRRELSGPVGRLVHPVHPLDESEVGLVQDAVPLVGVVAVQPDDERVAGALAALLQQMEGGDDAVRDGVAGCDPAEDVDEDRQHGRVAHDDAEAGRHYLGGGAAADVEEVRRLHPAVPFAGIGDDVEGAHDQSGAVADDADRAVVELDVVEIELLGPLLQRVDCRGVLERREVGLAVHRVAIDGDLAVQGHDATVPSQDQRVDLDQRR